MNVHVRTAVKSKFHATRYIVRNFWETLQFVGNIKSSEVLAMMSQNKNTCRKFCYRATQCVSAVFAVGRCPTVTSVYRYCIKTAKDIVKLLSRRGCPIILVS